MVATGQELFMGKIIFKVRGKSGNFSLSQGKVKSLKEVRKKWNFKSAILLLILFCSLYCIVLLFPNIKNTFVHFTDVNHVVLEYCSWNWMTSWCLVLKKINPFGRYELLIHVHCTWPAESINELVKGMEWVEGWVYYQD